MVEMVVESIRISLVTYQRVVILKEKDSDRFLPIWIGGTITHILVNDLSNDIFYARIVLDLNGQHLEIDSRPSDAIALALRAQVPIYVEESVLERAAVGAESAEAAQEGANEPTPSPERIAPPREEELKGLSAFKDFISSLDLDKLDKPGSS